MYLRADAYARSGKKLKQLMADFLARQAGAARARQPSRSSGCWSLPLAPRPIPVAAPGLLLAGDAGGFIDPLSGEGIWQALRTGMLAGEIAREAIAKGRLTGALRERYAAACKAAIDAPSRKKAFVQRALNEIVERRLYRSRIVRAALRVGYQRRALEMTKSSIARSGGTDEERVGHRTYAIAMAAALVVAIPAAGCTRSNCKAPVDVSGAWRGDVRDTRGERLAVELRFAQSGAAIGGSYAIGERSGTLYGLRIGARVQFDTESGSRAAADTCAASRASAGTPWTSRSTARTARASCARTASWCGRESGETVRAWAGNTGKGNERKEHGRSAGFGR